MLIKKNHVFADVNITLNKFVSQVSTCNKDHWFLSNLQWTGVGGGEWLHQIIRR